MKINEIAVKKPVSEAPVGAIKQGLKKFGAKALAKVGAKDTAMGIAGQVDTGDEANKLRGEFQNYMGQTGQNISKFDATDLSAWLKSKKYPEQAVDNNVGTGQLNKAMLDKILLKVVQDSKKVGGGATPAPTGTGDSPAPGAGAQQGAKGGTTGASTDTGSSTAPDGKAPPTANGSAAGPASEIPASIQSQLDLLNDADKKRLASMI
jgi:hypothetical protein